MRRYRSTVTDRGARFIANFEGGQSADGRFHPYYDKAGRLWTIGFGHTEGVSAHSTPLTRKQAGSLLRKDLNGKYAPPVARLLRAVGMRVEQHEFNALVSLSYNLGAGVFGNDRSLGQAIRKKDRGAVAAAILLYDKAANGQRLAGLTRRRHAERALFLTGRDDS